MKAGISAYLKKKKTVIDNALDKIILKPKGHSGTILTALRYVLKGGKRIRPILCLACAEAAGGKAKDALKTACAIELIHTYSLAHDDLPCMDNDYYRRGRLSCHRKFGEANAVLTGDAMLTYAFRILSSATKNARVNVRLIKEISEAAGIFGMISGQAADVALKKKSLAMQEYISIRKTGALIAASCKTGAISAGAKEKDTGLLFKYGEYAGLIFQIVDDILDNDGFAVIMGRRHAFEYAERLAEQAKESIARLGKKAKNLYAIADFILYRASQKGKSGK